LNSPIIEEEILRVVKNLKVIKLQVMMIYTVEFIQILEQLCSGEYTPTVDS
jgi:hypothetical protein